MTYPSSVARYAGNAHNKVPEVWVVAILVKILYSLSTTKVIYPEMIIVRVVPTWAIKQEAL